jgi:hypothetical protein
MSSDAKIAANRRNGSKSRGPRTSAGKAKASRNALRHGLAAISRDNPAFFPDIERLAKAICNDQADPLLFEQALIIAESEFILICVRAERIAAIERLRDPSAVSLVNPKNILAKAKAKFLAARLTFEKLAAATPKTERHQNGQPPDAPDPSADGNSEPEVHKPQLASQPKQIESYDEFCAVYRALPELDRLLRYERRAWSRRKRAIRTFTSLQHKE